MFQQLSLSNLQYLIVLLILLLTTGLYAQQSSGVSINENNDLPHPSAILDVQSVDRGLLPPRMTMAERDAISNPAEGLIIFNTTMNCPNYFRNGEWYTWCGAPQSQISSLDCGNAFLIGYLEEGVPADVNVEIPFEAGNGGFQHGITFNSTGVSGLTAELSEGYIQNGEGIFILNISGTPSSEGTAQFSINIGGQNCNIELNVTEPFVCGDMVTFTYKNSPVTYGSVESLTGKCWLDRNLGATQAPPASMDYSYNANTAGDLYQWGRDDDGHQNINSPTTQTKSLTDQPNNVLFITFSSQPSDWRSDNNNGRWNATPVINNPCPEGWRIPTADEFDEEIQSWSSQDFWGAQSSPLRMHVLTGYRTTSGSHQSQTGGIFYWTSSLNFSNFNVVDQYRANAINIQSNINQQNNISLHEGRAVRCIRAF